MSTWRSSLIPLLALAACGDSTNASSDTDTVDPFTDAGPEADAWVQPARVDTSAPPEDASWRYGGGDDYPDRVTPDWPITQVVSTRAELEDALAAASAGDVVYVADDAEIDLTGAGTPCIPSGVWLAGGRGRDGQPGGMLYTTTIVSTPMIAACGDDVRITGLRLIGPDPDECPSTYPNSCSGTDNTGGVNCRDCEPRPVGVNIKEASGVEVDNNELAGWSNAALVFRDQLGGSVHHNHIHHTQRQGLGYGVVLYGTQGSEVDIAWNRFDYNRHAIAGSGDAGQSYHAHDNLVLEHAIGHVFDMHGSNENTDNGSVDAGTNIRIHRNTVLVPNHYAMVIRGRPTEGAWLHDNCLAQGSPSQAARQTKFTGNFYVDVEPSGASSPNSYSQSASQCEPVRWCTSSAARGPWAYGARSSSSIGSLAIGDFDGDGVADVFSTTGSAWRVSKGGRTPWETWNTSSAKLGQLAFGDFDGDGKTDVLSVTSGHWHISSGGSTPWASHNQNISDAVGNVAFVDLDGDGVTDAFRTTGSEWQWSKSATGPWAQRNASSVPLGELGFGDFDGDGKVDVLRTTGSQWQVSSAGAAGWTTLNSSSATLSSLEIADVDGDGRDDILRRSGTRWLVSHSGSTGWQPWRIWSAPLSSVRFADFDGDGTDDAFAAECL